MVNNRPPSRTATVHRCKAETASLQATDRRGREIGAINPVDPATRDFSRVLRKETDASVVL